MQLPAMTPLTNDQLEQFLRLAGTLNREQLAWISGYVAALSSQQPAAANVQPERAAAAGMEQVKLTVLYGSRTGNGAGLAKKAARLAEESGLAVTVKSMEDYSPRELQSETNLLVIVSTHGEGEPPFAAKELHQFIFGKRAPKLANLRYAVLALGDSAYFQFCQTGKDFDQQLENLGGSRLHELAALDVDYELPALNWLQSALPAFGGGAGQASTETATETAVSDQESYSRNKPFLAEILDKTNLNGRQSDRKTLHIELNADMTYEPGDSAAVIPVNATGLVDRVIEVAGLQPGEEVEIKGTSRLLSEALKQELELTRITADVVKRYAEISSDTALAALLSDSARLQEYLYGHDVADLLSEFPFRLNAQQLVTVLRPLQPRLYSISSSPKATPGEVHLTVGVVEFENKGRNRSGACSGYLSILDVEEEKVPVYIQKNPDFRLPADDQTPIIMVGAGTGIAPFRAFVQHRAVTQKPGKSWLFFGNRNFENEFLYQAEWQKFLKTGALTKMHVAFSRDGEKRTYVQHKLAENAVEIYQWLENGAHFYICGDMKKMAADVQNTLINIVEKQGNKSKESAAEYVDRLQKEKRLQLDVY